MIYPVNYGYIPNTLASDGEEIDAYILGVTEPVEGFTGRCIAVIQRLNDESKLVVAPEDTSYTVDQIKEQTKFQEKYFKKKIIMTPVTRLHK